MRLAVLGANGLLGSNVVATGVDRGHDVVGTFHSEEPAFDIPLERLDVTETRAVRKVLDDVNPDAVVNCVAMTDLEACEDHPERAFEVNAQAPTVIAMYCASEDVRFGHVSTDYVFDGTAETSYSETDRANPVQEYGASKLAGEKEVRETMGDPLVARLSFVWGIHRALDELTGFPAWVRDSLLAGETVPLFTNQFVTPSRAGQAATVLVDLIETGDGGLYNVAARSCTTPFDFGKKIRDHLEGDAGEINESSLAVVDRAAERPAYTCLKVDKVEVTRGHSQPTLAADLDAVNDYI